MSNPHHCLEEHNCNHNRKYEAFPCKYIFCKRRVLTNIFKSYHISQLKLLSAYFMLILLPITGCRLVDCQRLR